MGRRAVFVTATDTEAGKTCVAGELATLFGKDALVVKPVQTGCLRREGKLVAPDVEAVRARGMRAEGLRLYEPPCSPHLAAELAGERLEAAALAWEVEERADSLDVEILIVEGAGGIHVPLNENETLLDLMARLQFPVLLVVANRLGCLNQAHLSLEALKSRGLKLAGMVLNRVAPEEMADPGCGENAGCEDEARILADNVRSLERLGERFQAPLLANIPHRSPKGMDSWLGGDGRVRSAESLLSPVKEALEALWEQEGGKSSSASDREAQEREARERENRLAFDREHLWHPYTSAVNPLPVFEAAATRGNRIVLSDGRELIDGMSSWWCAVHGYGNGRLTRAMTRQLESMSHVMFGGLTHEPAVRLGRRLLAMVPKGLSWLFYADSGSVAVEVALKMAVQYQVSKGREGRRHFLTPMGGYHGDTQGAMSVCDPVTGMHTLFAGLLPKHYFMERPACRFDEPYDPKSLDDARRHLERLGDEIAAVVLEPVVQGAGGMWFYHPQYLVDLCALCRERDILLLADEIATGFGRTGRLFACEWAGITPDIMCLGKALTGGMMTGAVTMATENVAKAIGQAPERLGGGVFMHGPTFMANPLFCAAACASIEELLSSPWKERVAMLERVMKEELLPLAGRKGVADVRVLGAIGVVETVEPVNMARLQEFFVERGVWIRPFGRLVYLMPPFMTGEEDARTLCRVVSKAVEAGLVQISG